MTATNRTCAVCPKPIRHGYLMCWEHWQLVPRDLQRSVYSTLGSLERCHRPHAASGREYRQAYETARDAAIAAAREAMSPHGGPTT